MNKNNPNVRIISGIWRGRILPVLTQEGLRPSGDRTRETLFNWLQFDLVGRNGLDLCAGTGALGFEALSRGASQCDLIEPNPQTVKQLKTTITAFNASNAAVYSTTAQHFLAHNTQTYDVVFIDPPFDLVLWQTLIDTLDQGDHLNNGALIYIEHPKSRTLEFPANWERRKTKTLGQVTILLYEYTTSPV